MPSKLSVHLTGRNQVKGAQELHAAFAIWCLRLSLYNILLLFPSTMSSWSFSLHFLLSFLLIMYFSLSVPAR